MVGRGGAWLVGVVGVVVGGGVGVGAGAGVLVVAVAVAAGLVVVVVLVVAVVVVLVVVCRSSCLIALHAPQDPSAWRGRQ